MDTEHRRVGTGRENLLSALPPKLDEELVETLARGTGVRVERIVSTGQASPEGFWYDQAEAEWVVVLQGSAELRFEGSDATIPLAPGDHVLIEPHQRHRVEWTSDLEPTVWLAVFFTP